MYHDGDGVKMKKIMISLIILHICLAVILTSGCTNQSEPQGDSSSSTYQSEKEEEQNQDQEESEQEEEEQDEEEEIIEKPNIEIADIDIVELTPAEATIDITVVLHNPNPIGGTFNKVNYTLYFKDERPIRGSGEYEFLGSSVSEKMVTIETGDTTLHIFFILDNQAVLQTLTTIAVQGQVWIKIIGEANLNLKLYSYYLPFEQEILVPI